MAADCRIEKRFHIEIIGPFYDFILLENLLNLLIFFLFSKFNFMSKKRYFVKYMVQFWLKHSTFPTPFQLMSPLMHISVLRFSDSRLTSPTLEALFPSESVYIKNVAPQYRRILVPLRFMTKKKKERIGKEDLTCSKG